VPSLWPRLDEERGLRKGEPPTGWYACAITVALEQLVRLERDPVVRAVAPTWRGSSHGIVGTTDLGQVREEVAQAVDKFIAAYRAANPP